MRHLVVIWTLLVVLIHSAVPHVHAGENASNKLQPVFHSCSAEQFPGSNPLNFNPGKSHFEHFTRYDADAEIPVRVIIQPAYLIVSSVPVLLGTVVFAPFPTIHVQAAARSRAFQRRGPPVVFS